MALTKVSYSMITGAVFNVLDFGAVSGNTVNQQAAMQAAITACAAAGGGVVYIPSGTYRITSPLLIPYGVSIQGAGSTATILSCLNCNGINFTSASYDGGNMFYSDFGISGAAGSTGNWAAVESILPPGGTSGVDSRDGLYFYRLRIYDFNQAFIISATWESHINECKVFRCNQAVSLGNFAMVMRITDCNFTYEGGFPTGSASGRGIEMDAPTVEGAFIRGCQIYGFPTVLYINNVATYTIFNDNDCYGTVYGVNLAGAATTGMSIQNNYFEISTSNGVGIRGAIQNAQLTNLYEVINNVFITGGGATGTKGITIGSALGTYSWNWRIRDNYFYNINSVDIEVFNARNVIISGNRFDSSTPTNNITIVGGSEPYSSNYITYNKLNKGISADGADIEDGRVMIYHNEISLVQTFGEVTFDEIKSTGNIYTFYDAAFVNTGSNNTFDYILPNTSMHLVTAYMETDTNTHLGPGVYAVVRQGTSTTVATITAFSGMTVTVTGAYKLNFANATGTNGIIKVSLTKTMVPS